MEILQRIWLWKLTKFSWEPSAKSISLANGHRASVTQPGDSWVRGKSWGSVVAVRTGWSWATGQDKGPWPAVSDSSGGHEREAGDQNRRTRWVN
jgi:hypothetical protein